MMASATPELDSLVTPPAPAPATYPEVDYALGKVSGTEWDAG